MSLDIYILSKEPIEHKGTGIFLRENGTTRELMYEEASQKYPDQHIQKVIYIDHCFWKGNITHNLNLVAINCIIDNDCNLYNLLWKTKFDKIPRTALYNYLLIAISKLKDSNLNFFEPKSNWGTKEDLLNFTIAYADALKSAPEGYKINKTL